MAESGSVRTGRTEDQVLRTRQSRINGQGPIRFRRTTDHLGLQARRATINLPVSVEVPEIQVFEIGAEDDDVAEGVLAAIDKAVRTPIIFEISRGEGANGTIRMVAAHKQLGTGAPRWAPTSAPTGSSRPATESRFRQPSTDEPVHRATPAADARGVARRRECVGRRRQTHHRSVARARDRRLGAETPERTAAQSEGRAARTLKSKQAALVGLTSASDSPAAGNTN